MYIIAIESRGCYDIPDAIGPFSSEIDALVWLEERHYNDDPDLTPTVLLVTPPEVPEDK
jgi:hypothetical protein